MTFAPATDAHVHLMPNSLMTAIRGALYDAAEWEIDHPTDRETMEAELTAEGVAKYITLPYAHKPEIAAELNDWVLAQCANSEMAVPFATVHGDDDVGEIVKRAFEAGARGLKFQCPVQGCGPADPRLDPAFELAAEYDRPIMFHAGTAPMFRDNPAVGFDQFAQFVETYPEIRACCAHMGTYDHEAFIECARENEQVFLDTTVAMSASAPEYMDFDPTVIDDDVFEDLAGSIMYGSDYPNIPYPYEDERTHLLSRDLSAEAFEQLFRGAAERFLGEN